MIELKSAFLEMIMRTSWAYFVIMSALYCGHETPCHAWEPSRLSTTNTPAPTEDSVDEFLDEMEDEILSLETSENSAQNTWQSGSVNPNQQNGAGLRTSRTQFDHFQKSMQFADGKDFTSGTVKTQMDSLNNILQVFTDIYTRIAKTTSAPDVKKTQTTVEILSDAYKKFTRQIGYNPIVPEQSINWDQAAWRNMIQPLDMNFLLFLENAITNCEKMMLASTKQSSVLSKVKKVVSSKSAQNKAAIKKNMLDQIGLMKTILSNIKIKIKTLEQGEESVKMDFLKLVAISFHQKFNAFMEIYANS